MSETTTRSTYSRVAILLHWLIGLAIIANLAGGLLIDAIPKPDIGAFMGLHKATGITVIALSIIRLAWRLTHRPPPLAITLKRWEGRLAHATHWVFYIMMIAVPLTGWLMSSAGGRKYPLNWFGLFDLPFLPVAQDKDFANSMAYAHLFLSYTMIGLVAMHIAAAMKHHVWDRDNTVERILPLLRARSSIASLS